MDLKNDSMKKNIIEKANILLITIDSLRRDSLGCMGNPNNTSPNIDSLAKEGYVFNEAITNGPEPRHHSLG